MANVSEPVVTAGTAFICVILLDYNC